MSDFTKNEKVYILKLESLQREASNVRKDISILLVILVAINS